MCLAILVVERFQGFLFPHLNTHTRKSLLLPRIEDHKRGGQKSPQQKRVKVKAIYLLECYPCSRAHRLRVVSVVVFSVPVTSCHTCLILIIILLVLLGLLHHIVGIKSSAILFVMANDTNFSLYKITSWHGSAVTIMIMSCL